MNEMEQTPESDPGQIKTSALATTTPQTRNGFRQSSEPPDLITKQEFAKRVSISVRSVEKMLAEKTVPHIRLGRKIVRIPWTEAMDHLRRNYTVNAR